MAWIPTIEETRAVPVVPIPTVDQVVLYQIDEIRIRPHDPRVTIVLAEGFAKDGEFEELERRVIEAPASPELAAVMSVLCDSSKTLYDQIRDCSYELLLALGELPEGTPE